jgi:hypothetical protein
LKSFIFHIYEDGSKSDASSRFIFGKRKKQDFNKEIDKWLDRLDWLDKLEEELKNKK